jgi:hypothetical protein
MNRTQAANIDPAHFECAVVRLVSMPLAKDRPGQLFFASVSLLARGRQRPATSDRVERTPVGSTKKRLYFRRTVLTVEAALSWYRGLDTDAGSVTPVPELEAEQKKELDGIPLAIPKLVDRPAWPRLGLSLGRDLMVTADELAEPCPFLGSTASRIHRRFASVGGFEEVLEDANCVRMLRQWVHVDLRQYPEYVGSAVLVVPDPFVRRIDSFYVSNQSGGEDEVVRIVPRSPGGLQNLSLTLFERQAHLLTRFERRDVPPDGMIVVPSNESVGATGFVLGHEVYGPLQASAATHYLRAVGLNLNVEETAAVIAVSASDSPNSADTSYQSTAITSRQTVVAGRSSAQSVDVRIEEAAFRRQQAFEASHYEQTWLEARDREGALNFVRSRIHRAQETLLVADPYLGFRQIRQFMFAISHPGVTVTLLTSRLAFESQYAEHAESTPGRSLGAGVPASRAEEFARFDELRKEVESLKKHTKGDIRVWVLPGDSPELHDRFLAVDKNVWFFGGSFNALGDRASLVVRMPHAEGILDRLAAMITRARTLDQHIAMRAVPPSPSALPPLSWWRRKLIQWLDQLRKVAEGRR